MSGAEFSLLAVTFSFAGLVWWVYTPRRRSRLESYAAIPLDDDVEQGRGEERDV